MRRDEAYAERNTLLKVKHGSGPVMLRLLWDNGDSVQMIPSSIRKSEMKTYCHLWGRWCVLWIFRGDTDHNEWSQQCSPWLDFTKSSEPFWSGHHWREVQRVNPKIYHSWKLFLMMNWLSSIRDCRLCITFTAILIFVLDLGKIVVKPFCIGQFQLFVFDLRNANCRLHIWPRNLTFVCGGWIN